MQGSNLLRVLLVALALALIAAAVALEITGHDAAKAWEGLGTALGSLVALHVAPPR